ncbi:hypothetical protein W04_3332 [Pseudoalteromonas sp. SW0106-04]|uniref:hypothetical protein n=1 Tax=Pseudoalteromonas sp. SW0106-04 TaxID=1702169 RepID=UPI0006B59CD2|nr:hypothetical protein [Pseudoalteromonas sp. SW0106-04]GAP76760.1 hypothetical protein W04_3332 [Pseudoalteromonas sp. SW0106-04]
MLYKQTIRAGEMREISKRGHHFKLIKCQTALRLRVHAKNELLLDTEVRAGFEIAFAKEFERIVIEAEQEQRVEIWADIWPLGYEAPAQNANNLDSAVLNHYGDAELTVPFEPNRLNVRMVSDAPWWYGGSNVTKESGIPVAANQEVEIPGAAEIWAAIEPKGEYLPVNKALELGSGFMVADYGQTRNAIYFTAGAGGDSYLYKITKEGVERLELGQYYQLNTGGKIVTVCGVDENTYAYTSRYGLYLTQVNDETGEQKNFAIPRSINSPGQYISQVRGMQHLNGKYYLDAVLFEDDAQGGKTYACIAVYDGATWEYKHKIEQTQPEFRAFFSNGVDGFYTVNSGNVKFIPEAELVELSDYSTRPVIGSLQGADDHPQWVKSEGQVLVYLPGANGSAALINDADKTFINLGTCDGAILSNAGVTLLNNGEFNITTDQGNSYVTAPAPHDFAWTTSTKMFLQGPLLFVVNSEFFGLYSTEKQRVVAKQRLRILKGFS